MKNPAIIIPCYNEGPILRDVALQLVPLGYSIICVDDGSDGTFPPPAELLRDLPVTCLRHPFNMGQGAALQTGMDYARQNGHDAVIHFDADGQHNPDDIPAFLQALDNGADVALGSRFLRAEDTARIPFRKRVMLRGARLVNRMLTGLNLTDAHNGFRALGPRALSTIRFRENRMAHASEILVQIRQNGLNVVEIPTTIRYTDYSIGKGQRLSNSINILLDLLMDRLIG